MGLGILLLATGTATMSALMTLFLGGGFLDAISAYMSSGLIACALVTAAVLQRSCASHADDPAA